MKDYRDLASSISRRANKPNAGHLSTSPTSGYSTHRASIMTTQSAQSLPQQSMSPLTSISSLLAAQNADLDRKSTISAPAELSSIRPPVELATDGHEIGPGSPVELATHRHEIGPERGR
jgi:hypothetical protein